MGSSHKTVNHAINQEVQIKIANHIPLLIRKIGQRWKDPSGTQMWSEEHPHVWLGGVDTGTDRVGNSGNTCPTSNVRILGLRNPTLGIYAKELINQMLNVISTKKTITI